MPPLCLLNLLCCAVMCCDVLCRAVLWLPGLPQQLPPVVGFVVARPVARNRGRNQVLLRGRVQRFEACQGGSEGAAQASLQGRVAATDNE